MASPLAALAGAATECLGPSVHSLEAEIRDRMLRIPTKLNSYGYDAWGFHPGTAARALAVTTLMYRYWFRVETHGLDRLPAGRVLLISNHAGQVALHSLRARILRRSRPEARRCRAGSPV